MFEKVANFFRPKKDSDEYSPPKLLEVDEFEDVHGNKVVLVNEGEQEKPSIAAYRRTNEGKLISWVTREGLGGRFMTARRGWVSPEEARLELLRHQQMSPKGVDVAEEEGRLWKLVSEQRNQNT